MRILIIEGHPQGAREEDPTIEIPRPSEIYRRVLARIAPDARFDILDATVPDAAPPQGAALADYDGFVWGG